MMAGNKSNTGNLRKMGDPVYTVRALDSYHDTQQHNSNGVWVPARPYFSYKFFRRLRAAWFVLTAKYDALDWEDR